MSKRRSSTVDASTVDDVEFRGPNLMPMHAALSFFNKSREMGRTKSKSKSKKAALPLPADSDSITSSEPTYTSTDLLAQASVHLISLEYDQAKSLCERAIQLVEAKSGPSSDGSIELTEAFELLGTVELELGELDVAREHFLSCIQHSLKTSNPSPAPHLYLAQLSSPSESLTHFSNALTILQAKLAVIERSKLGLDGSAGGSEELEEEGELRRSASRALVGMTELYLTDLCFEEEAEQNCETNLTLAAKIDPSDPEVYQTMASVRLSQERPDDAKKAAMKGWSLWRNLEPDSASYPPYSTRLGMAHLLLELSLHSSALEILQRLENEDDEDGGIWYLSGWAWWLLGEERADVEITGEEESKAECWSESRLCLENYLRIDERDPEVSDPDQLAHVHELLAKLIEAGVVASVGQQEGDEDGWNDEYDSDEAGDDVEMEE